ncbi:MAG: glutamate synthase subunit alpha, partial [Firmicutes bacterium]|nr:glutamate synthase subunit alpha [Bacillota bacterium]
ATSGQAYINGKAGERFCVRNSGAAAVVEGVGNHGCEYMTGGRVAILGPVGKNFAAGMSGGIANVLDTDHTLYLNLNKEFVSMNQVSEKEDILELRALIEGHVKETGSPFGREILDSFDEYLPYFVKVMPNDYSRMLTAISRFEEKGLSHEDAEMEAFYAMGKE